MEAAKRPRKKARTATWTRQQDTNGLYNDEEEDQDEEEEPEEEECEEVIDEEEDGGKRSEATTRGGPAADSIERRQIYRESLMEMIHPVDLATPSIRSELTQAGFSLTSAGRVVPFFFDVPEGSNEYLRVRDAMEDRPESGATGEKEWLAWLNGYLHNTLKTESRSCWLAEHSPFPRNDANFHLSLPRPDMQYHHAKPALVRIFKGFETTGDLMERARQEIIKILRIKSLERAWDDIVGAVESEDRERVTPFARGGLDTVLLPFFYVQFKAVDERLEVGLNQLFTDLVFATQKMKGIRQLAGQMDNSPVGLVFGSAMTPRYWELYVAWQGDEDDPHIMMVARDSLVDINGLHHYVTMIDRITSYTNSGFPLARWMLQVKMKDLALKDSLGPGERWSLDGMQRHKSYEDSTSDPTGSVHKVALWRSAAQT